MNKFRILKLRRVINNDVDMFYSEGLNPIVYRSPVIYAPNIPLIYAPNIPPILKEKKYVPKEMFEMEEE